MASESLTNTNISDTYVGVLHAKGEPIPPTGLEYVYDGFGNKSSLLIGREGQGVDFDGDVGPNFLAALINLLYPIGAVVLSTDNTNPGDRYPNTTWAQKTDSKLISGTYAGGTIVRASAVTPASIGIVSQTHNLSKVPTLFGATAICTSAEFGFDVGDEVIINTQVDGSHTSNRGAATTVYADDTKVYFRTQGEPTYFAGEIASPDGLGRYNGEAGLAVDKWDIVLWWVDDIEEDANTYVWERTA